MNRKRERGTAPKRCECRFCSSRSCYRGQKTPTLPTPRSPLHRKPIESGKFCTKTPGSPSHFTISQGQAPPTGRKVGLWTLPNSKCNFLFQEIFRNVVKTHLDTLHEHFSDHLGRSNIAATEAALDHLLFMTGTFFENMEWCTLISRWYIPMTSGIFPRKAIPLQS